MVADEDDDGVSLSSKNKINFNCVLLFYGFLVGRWKTSARRALFHGPLHSHDRHTRTLAVSHQVLVLFD